MLRKHWPEIKKPMRREIVVVWHVLKDRAKQRRGQGFGRLAANALLAEVIPPRPNNPDRGTLDWRHGIGQLFHRTSKTH